MSGTRHPNYYDGMTLGVGDFIAEQDYLDGLRRRHNARLRTWGVAAGLEVSIRSDEVSLQVSPGLAIDAEGQEILLTGEQVVGLESDADGFADLFVAASRVSADPSSQSFATGFKRIDHEPVLVLVPRGGSVAPLAIFLGSAVVARGRITALELDARRHCGIAAGSVHILARGAGGGDDDVVGARLSAATERQATDLLIEAPEMAFDGSVQVAGTLFVRDPVLPGTLPHAMLDIQRGDANLLAIYGAPPTSAPGGSPQPLDPLLLFVACQDGTTGINVDSPEATLDVGGDIALDGGRAIVLAPGGTISCPTTASDPAAAPAAALSLGDQTTFSASGNVLFYAGPDASPAAPNQVRIPTLRIDARTGTQVDPPLVLDPIPAEAGLTRVGIGVGLSSPLAMPGLTVAGGVQSLKVGFVFKDNSVQTTGAIGGTVPIGTILDWWPGVPSKAESGKPSRYPVDIPSGFMICNGDPIPDGPFAGTNLPDLRGQYARGAASIAEAWPAAGSTGGSASHFHVMEQWPPHTHSYNHAHPPVSTNTGKGGSDLPSELPDDSFAGADHQHSFRVGLDLAQGQSSPAQVPSADTDPVDNQPPTVALFKIMRVK